MPLTKKIEICTNENPTTNRPGKTALQTKQPIIKRSALGEVGNKIHVHNEGVTSKLKNEPVKPKFATKELHQSKPKELSKPTIKEIIKPTQPKHTRSEITQSKLVSKITAIQGNKDIKTCKSATIVSTQAKNIINNLSNEDKKKIFVRQESTNVITNALNICLNEEQVGYSTKELMRIEDVDIKDKNNHLLVAEYVQDIYKYLQTLEDKYFLRANFLSNHKCTPKMRSTLVNWLIDVHINFNFLQETLHLSIAILDRYMQEATNIGKENYQLVGISAMFIAAKYEEVYIPDLSELVYICDNSFTAQQILKMEIHILNKLKFNLGRPLSIHFLRRYNKVAKVTSMHHNLGKYLLEIALIDINLCYVKPSLQAAAACCFSIIVLEEKDNPSDIWTDSLVYYSSYKYSDFQNIMIKFANALIKYENSNLDAIKKKFAAASFGKISTNPKLRSKLVKEVAEWKS